MKFELGGVTLDAEEAPLLVTKFAPGAASARGSDVDRPGRDGVIFGTDLRGAAPWTFEVQAFGETPAAAEQLLSALAAAWAPVAGPVAAVALRYELNGRWRRVYGRPRLLTQPSGWSQVDQGTESVELAFTVGDPLHYADDTSAVVLGIVPAARSAWRFPMTPPFGWLTGDGQPQVRAADVGGDAPTPLRVTVTGPVTRPWVRVGDVLVEFLVDLAYDESVTVDARAESITRQDGASVAGWLSPRTRLADLVLPPGQHDVSFGGLDVTGTATATVAWRSAWRSI